MNNTFDYIGAGLLFFTVFCLLAIPTIIIFYFVNLWLNKKDPSREARIAFKKQAGISKWIRTSAGVSLIVLGSILFLWPFFRLFILKDIEGGYTLKGISDFLIDAIPFLSFPLLIIAVGKSYILKKTTNNASN